MARAPFRILPWLLFAVGLGACGGSSSETPWPVEPEQSQAGPPAENTKPPIITEERPDAGKSSRP